MKQEMNVSANLYDPTLLRNLVEKLASNNRTTNSERISLPGGMEALESSTVQAYIMGTFDLKTKNGLLDEQFNIPFTSCFIFTCTKEKYGTHMLEWSASLS